MKNKAGITVITVLLLTLGSCNFMESTDEREVVARVNDSFLYKEDIESLISDNMSSEDSTLMVSNYITRWATQKLLIDRAKVNLSQVQQEDFERLVLNYRNELYSKAYTDAIIATQLDTTVPFALAEQYYNHNGENFRLNEDLVKLRYLNLSRNNNDFERISERFQRFSPEDKEELLEMAIKFTSYSFNDSVWVKSKQVYDKIGPLTPDSNEELLKKQNFLQLQDSLGVYLVFVEDVKFRGEQAPLEYSLPTIKQILLNKRKLELVKKLEKDITQDAIKNEQFEIYN